MVYQWGNVNQLFIIFACVGLGFAQDEIGPRGAENLTGAQYTPWVCG